MPSPHGEAIGLEVVAQGEDHALVRVAYSEKLVGDPESGIIHGGVLTTMLDNASGMAVRSGSTPDEEKAIATLDLRIDYLRGAMPRKPIHAEAHCYKRTKNVAFVRGLAYEDDRDDPVATSVATFMMGTPNKPRTP
jgi:uncharacterized protein (TIGR00369 family)